jgi:hypothetical protein
MARLRPWSEDVWFAEAPLRFFGMPLGTRMTLVRLADGDLLLHSPVALDPGLLREIASEGPVRHVVSPNKLHHLYLGSAREAFPDARLYAPPGLAAKRPELRFDAELADPRVRFAGLPHTLVRGSRWMEEVVFFHPPSRTLLVGDLVEHFGPESPAWMRLLMRLVRMYGRPRMPPDWQLSFRDRAATRASFERILEWDFDRILLAHGRPVERGAREPFVREYAWALRER